eukprot:scaffold73938_cov36-Phaeocystis_antarctica.AAC.2
MVPKQHAVGQPPLRREGIIGGQVGAAVAGVANHRTPHWQESAHRSSAPCTLVATAGRPQVRQSLHAAEKALEEDRVGRDDPQAAGGASAAHRLQRVPNGSRVPRAVRARAAAQRVTGDSLRLRGVRVRERVGRLVDS